MTPIQIFTLGVCALAVVVLLAYGVLILRALWFDWRDRLGGDE